MQVSRTGQEGCLQGQGCQARHHLGNYTAGSVSGLGKMTWSIARYASQYAWDDAHRVNGHAPNDAWYDARNDARNDDARDDAGNDDARHDDAWNDGVSTSDD